MNDPNDLSTDRIPLSDVKSFGKLSGMLEEALAGSSLLPPTRPPFSVGTVSQNAKLPEPPKSTAEPPKTAPTAETPSPEAASAVGTPAPEPRWVREAFTDMFKMNRKKGVIASAAASIVAGGLALNTLFSGAGNTSSTPNPETNPSSVIAAAQIADSPTPTSRSNPAPQVQVEPASGTTTLTTPIIPTIEPVLPVSTPRVEPSTSATTIPVIAPPIVSVEPRLPSIPAPSVPVTIPTTPTPIIPTAFADPVPGQTGNPTPPVSPVPVLPVPTAPGNTTPTSPPSVPATAPGGIPVIPAPGGIPVIPTTPGIPEVKPTPTPVPSTPKVDPAPIVVTPTIPGETTNTTPSTPAPLTVPMVGNTNPVVAPVVPAPVETTNSSNPPARSATAPAPTVVPEVKPVEPAPSNTTPGAFRPVPESPLPSGPAPSPIPAPGIPAATLTMTKPVGGSEVQPVTNQEPPKTDFDVDLHEPKAGDTYGSISKMHYGDSRYAEALRTFNRGLELGRGGIVQIPPMYILRQRFSQVISSPRATSSESNRNEEWGPATTRASDNGSTYLVKRSGMTLKDVAEEVLGDRREWNKLWDLNPRIDPNTGLTEGTKLQLPAETRNRK